METCREDGLGWGPCEDEVLPGRELCGDEVDDDCDGAVTCGETVWSRRFGVDRDEYAMRVEVDADGYVYVAGGYRDSFDFPGPLPVANTSRDVLVAKLAPQDGEPLWSVGISGGSNSFARDVAVAPDGRVALVASVAGTVDIQGGPSHPSFGGNDVLVALFDADGGHLFSQRYGDADEEHPMAVDFDPAGNLVVSGFFRGEIDFGSGALSSGDYDAFVVTMQPDGTVVSASSFGGKGDDLPRAMAIDPSGAIVLAGDYAGEIDFGDGVVAAQGNLDGFVAAFEPPDTSGALALRWAERFGSDGAGQVAYGVAVDAVGRVAISGRFAGTLSLGPDELQATAGGFFVSLFDAEGRPLWARGLEGAANGGGWAVRFDSRNRVVAAGFYEGPASLDGVLLPEGGLREQNVLVAKYELDGAVVWGRGV
jgi:hypothetical protein